MDQNKTTVKPKNTPIRVWWVTDVYTSCYPILAICHGVSAPRKYTPSYEKSKVSKNRQILHLEET